MRLYHGSNTDIDTIDLDQGSQYKDFGKGFYLTTHHQIATYLTNYVLSELVKYVKEDTGCSIEQAMDRVYNSPLMELLQDEESELYTQSPAYLYEMIGGKSLIC